MMQETNVTDQNVTDQPWGFWIIIRNEADAHWALKISGVVFFLMGIGNIFFSCLSIELKGFGIAELFVIALGVFLIYSGVELRNKRYSTFWISIALFFINFAILIGLHVFFALKSFAIFQSALAHLLVTLQAVLLISGIRGWFFLRRRAAIPSFF